MVAQAENVLVIPRDLLFAPPRRRLEGFRANVAEAYLGAAVEHASYRPRALVEDDPTFKQLIPYAVVTSGSRVFLMRRKGGGERRLHDRLSLGVGGHVNDGDAGGGGVDAAAAIRAALWREVHEELHVETTLEPTLLGVLNDDSNAVGRVHFGVVFGLCAREPRVRVRETDELEGEFVESRHLGRYLEGMETWSRFVAEALWPSVDRAELARKEELANG